MRPRSSIRTNVDILKALLCIGVGLSITGCAVDTGDHDSPPPAADVPIDEPPDGPRPGGKEHRGGGPCGEEVIYHTMEDGSVLQIVIPYECGHDGFEADWADEVELIQYNQHGNQTPHQI